MAPAERLKQVEEDAVRIRFLLTVCHEALSSEPQQERYDKDAIARLVALAKKGAME